MDEAKFVPLEREMGQLLMRLRGDRSQEEVSKAVGVRRETIKQWENAERHIKAVDLVRLSAYYNVSVDYLLGIAQQPFISEDIQIAQKTLGLSAEAMNNVLSIGGNMPKMLEVLDEILSADTLIDALADIITFRNTAEHFVEDVKTKSKIDADFMKYQKVFYANEAKDQAEFLMYKATKTLETLIKSSVFCDLFDTVEKLNEEAITGLSPKEAGNGETE